MDPTSRWLLLGKSTNQFGVTHFTLSRREVGTADADDEELMRVLKREFGAVDEGELAGPYSDHKFLKVGQLRLGLIVDCLYDWLDLYARDESNEPAMDTFVARLLESLNTQEHSVASRGLVARIWKWLKTRRIGILR